MLASAFENIKPVYNDLGNLCALDIDGKQIAVDALAAALTQAGLEVLSGNSLVTVEKAGGTGIAPPASDDVLDSVFELPDDVLDITDGGSSGASPSYSIDWNKSINPTQDLIPGTNIPKSFTIEGQTINGNTVWVHGNATKHMGEFVNSANGSIMVENELMNSFQDSVAEILPKVESGRNFFDNINGWEIGINGDTGVIYHALYK